MSELLPITSHIFYGDYNNNSRIFSNDGVTINGVKFTDFSWSQNNRQGVFSSLSNITNPRTIRDALTTRPDVYEAANKIMGMIFINWNGAVIKNGNFTTGEDVIISTTPEFLAIFNNITKVTYENIYLESKVENRVPLTVLIKNTVNTDITITSVGYNLKEYEVVDVIYENGGSSAIKITINNNSNIDDVENCKFKVPNPLGLKIDVPANGYAEVNFTKLGNIVYVRGV